MPPSLALGLCVVLVYWLLRSDRQYRAPLVAAMWIPQIWLLIRASRPVTAWYGGGGGSAVEGNTTEALIALALIIAAFLILQRRQVSLTAIPGLNVFMFILLVYLGLSCLWAPLPFVAFKRWFKEVGNILILLVILTDDRPVEALKTIAIRAACVLVPLSVVLIKYFPEFGRAYSKAGGRMVTGVTDQKNTLGVISCLFVLCLVWDMMDVRKREKVKIFSRRLLPQLILLGASLWLLWTSQSKTSLVALLFGLGIFFSASLPVVRNQASMMAKLGIVVVVSGLAVAGFATTYAAPLLAALGRDVTLTGRTDIWEAVLKQPTDPIFGTGFQSFWVEYTGAVWAEFENFSLTSTHSGYIDMYLDAGLIGCVLLACCLLYTSWSLAGSFSPDSNYSRMMYVFIMMTIIMNFSESYFFRLGPLWFFVMFSMLSRSSIRRVCPDLNPARRDDEPAFPGHYQAP